MENVIFISFDFPNCVNIRKRLPSQKVQWLVHKREIDDNLIKILCDNKLDLDVQYRYLTKENVNLLHLYVIEVNCWTCDNKEDAEKLVDYGVDYITTNILE